MNNHHDIKKVSLGKENWTEIINYDKKQGGWLDQRPRAWTKISFKGLIEPLMEMRKNAKETNDVGQDQFVKLLINTIYGVIGSSQK